MIIHLNGLSIYAYHGVIPQENLVGAEYLINISIKTDFSEASQYDKLEYTINYADIYEDIKKEMAIPSQLLEHVAYRIAQRLFKDFSMITEIKISINKKNPPMGGNCREVGIDTTYTR